MFPTPTGGCTLEWVLEESSDSSTWTTADSGSIAAAPWTVAIPETSFTTEHLYRIKSREVCSGTPGAYIVSADFVHECTDAVAVTDSVFPFAASSLIAYLPSVCPCTKVVDAISGTVGVHGPAWGGLVARWDSTSGDIAVQPDDDGVAAYGTIPALTSVGGDMTISALVNLGSVSADSVLFSAGPMGFYLTQSDTINLIVETEAGQQTINTEISVSTTYQLDATFDESTGVCSLWVDGNGPTTSGSTPSQLRALPPRWEIGGSAGTWVTRCGVWNEAINFLA